MKWRNLPSYIASQDSTQILLIIKVNEEKEGVPMRILVVDKEPLIRFLFSILFAKNAEVKTVESTEEALIEIGTQKYDLCFLNYNLPGMKVLEASQVIKERAEKTKLIIMTESSFDETIKKQIEDNAYAFIENPFVLSRILDVVKNVDAAQVG